MLVVTYKKKIRIRINYSYQVEKFVTSSVLAVYRVQCVYICKLLPFQYYQVHELPLLSQSHHEIRTLQESTQEGVITRDIHRTFPAHDYFKDTDGDGQDSLYKICKVTFHSYLSPTIPLKSSATRYLPLCACLPANS